MGIGREEARKGEGEREMGAEREEGESVSY